MKTVIGFPDRNTVAEEAAEWLVRLDSDEPPDRALLDELRAWMRRGPAHRAELESLASLWRELNTLTDLAVPLRPMRAVESRDGGSPGPARRFARGAAALTAAVLLAVSFIGWQLMSARESVISSNGLYATAVGQQSESLLADGSGVMLNTNSQIRVDYGNDYRRIYLLQGEAHFTVAKDAGRPFRVYVGSRRIEALGTAFSVYLKGPEVDVTVSEGRVSLASVDRAGPPTAESIARDDAEALSEDANTSAKEEILQPLGTVAAGYVATLSASFSEPEAGTGEVPMIRPVPPAEIAQRLAWREGVLMFAGDPLEDVIKEMSRYTTVTIEIPDPQVRNMRVGGRLPVGGTAAMLAALETNFRLEVRHVGHDRVVLTAAAE